MGLNNAQDAIIDDRRRLVASLLLRKATQREIVHTLESQEHLNPETGEPWSLGTINADVQALKRQWRKDAKQSIEMHRARQIAELDEVVREGWTLRDLQSILRAMKQQAELLGLNAPIQQEQLNIAMTLEQWHKRATANRQQATETLADFDDE